VRGLSTGDGASRAQDSGNLHAPGTPRKAASLCACPRTPDVSAHRQHGAGADFAAAIRLQASRNLASANGSLAGRSAASALKGRERRHPPWRVRPTQGPAPPSTFCRQSAGCARRSALTGLGNLFVDRFRHTAGFQPVSRATVLRRAEGSACRKSDGELWRVSCCCLPASS
jgi:hypothetical protein